MHKDKVDAIKEMANLKIESILDALGINYEDRYNYVVAPCPIHDGNRRDAFSYHLDRGMWKCFSRACDEKYGSDVIGLIRGIKKCTFMQAVHFLGKFVDTSLSQEEIQKLKDQRDNREFIQATKRHQQETHTYDKSCLDKLKQHIYLETRGYPRWLIDKYQIGACLEPHKYMSNRIVVPIINKDGEIVGFTGRTLNPNWKELNIPKWKHSKGSWTSHNLFNVNFAAKYIEKTGAAIVCEGPLDVLRLEQAGVHNGVAILGKKFHPGQMNILVSVGATRLLDALDNDTAGRVGSSGMKKTASCLFNIERVKIPKERKDIGEMSIEEIKEVFCEFTETVRN